MEKTKRGNWTDNPCWYVSVQDAGRTALVLGPFTTEAECREYAYNDAESGGTHKHNAVLKAAEEMDPKSWFYAWGMVKVANGYYEPRLMNERFRSDGLWTGTLTERTVAA